MFSTAAWGCAESEDLSISRQAIVGGRPAPDPEFSSVVSLQVQRSSGEWTFFCSGVLIRDDVVLTAAHCLMDDEGFPFVDLFVDGRIGVATGADAVNPAKVYVATEVAVHPDYVAHVGESGWTEAPENDIGMLHLSEAIPASQAVPADVISDYGVLRTIVRDKLPVYTVGYGVDENGALGTRLVSTNTIDAYCHIDDHSPEPCEGVDEDGGTYVFPPGIGLVISASGSCSGDSGGPVFADVDGAKTVVGIVSFSDTECNSLHGFMSALRYSGWIANTARSMRGTGSDCSAMPLRSSGDSLWGLLLLPGMLLFRRRPRCLRS